MMGQSCVLSSHDTAAFWVQRLLNAYTKPNFSLSSFQYLVCDGMLECFQGSPALAAVPVCKLLQIVGKEAVALLSGKLGWNHACGILCVQCAATARLHQENERSSTSSRIKNICRGMRKEFAQGLLKRFAGSQPAEMVFRHQSSYLQQNSAGFAVAADGCPVQGCAALSVCQSDICIQNYEKPQRVGKSLVRGPMQRSAAVYISAAGQSNRGISSNMPLQAGIFTAHVQFDQVWTSICCDSADSSKRPDLSTSACHRRAII